MGEAKLPAPAYRRQAQGGASGKCKHDYRIGFDSTAGVRCRPPRPCYGRPLRRDSQGGIQPTCPSRKEKNDNGITRIVEEPNRFDQNYRWKSFWPFNALSGGVDSFCGHGPGPPEGLRQAAQDSLH